MPSRSTTGPRRLPPSRASYSPAFPLAHSRALLSAFPSPAFHSFLSLFFFLVMHSCFPQSPFPFLVGPVPLSLSVILPLSFLYLRVDPSVHISLHVHAQGVCVCACVHARVRFPSAFYPLRLLHLPGVTTFSSSLSGWKNEVPFPPGRGAGGGGVGVSVLFPCSLCQ